MSIEKIAFIKFQIENSYEEMFNYRDMVVDLSLPKEEEKKLMLELDALAEEQKKRMPHWTML